MQKQKEEQALRYLLAGMTPKDVAEVTGLAIGQIDHLQRKIYPDGKTKHKHHNPLQKYGAIVRRVRQPSPPEIRAARKRAGMTQREAAQLIADTTTNTVWANYEADEGDTRHRGIGLDRWELFLLYTDQHPQWQLRARQDTTTGEQYYADGEEGEDTDDKTTR